MAVGIMMKDPSTGIVKKGFYGFSWTTFCFGGIPALCRGDIIIGLAVIVLNLITCFITGIIWAFLYNKYYTVSLVEKGYQFIGSEDEVARAKAALGIIGERKFSENGDVSEERAQNSRGSVNLDNLEKLGELRNKGVLTQDEFQAQKAKILGR
jgi:hypothetical protein